MTYNNMKSCQKIYTVRAGDTLYAVSEAFGVPVRVLMAVNKITNPYNLQIGRRLIIPSYPGSSCAPVNPNAPMPMLPPENDDRKPQVDPMPDVPATPEPICKGSSYTVVKGDSFYSIAKKHRINLNALLEANPYIDPYNLIIGTKLCIPSR